MKEKYDTSGHFDTLLYKGHNNMTLQFCLCCSCPNLRLEVTIASEVLPWVFETKTKYNHLLIPQGQVV